MSLLTHPGIVGCECVRFCFLLFFGFFLINGVVKRREFLMDGREGDHVKYIKVTEGDGEWKDSQMS